ncbi:MAG: 16S rRNA (cytosine(1402)-N(4))-methyltransferase RsmH [Bacteroidales bacterium]|nr:16S rRNA (cytosine(1402)-N(4))-methyltransferase RsmH [Bacteroidales bacterium]
MTTYHTPALLEASIDGLSLRPDGVYVDATFGGGGHSREILRRLGPEGRLYAFDQDEDAQANLPDDSRLVFVHGNFRYLKNFMRYHGVEQIDGLLADLGVSSHHFDDEGRGFSFRFGEGALDMRMNRRASLRAADVLATYSQEDLASVLRRYGELAQAGRAADLIVKARSQQPVETVARLREVLDPVLQKDREKKELAKVFQALRIEVNGEMEALEQLLRQSLELLRPGGRLAIISYHSLEDRMVKNFMRAGNFEGQVEQDFYGNRLSPLRSIGKVIVPTAEEEAANPRARSAKLRIAEKI